MSPIPKPEKSPIQKAIEAMLEQASKPPMLVVHPRDEQEIAALIEQSKKNPIVVGATSPVVKEGPLMKAYREQIEGQRITSVSWDEVQMGSKTELERQLEDSLWALAEGIQPMRYQMDVLRHIPHMRGSSHRVRRVHADSVDILCQCKWVMRFGRCAFTEGGRQCEEECLVPEATLLADARCALHKGDPWKEGSRFYRCSHIGFPHDPSTRCTRVATLVHVDGTHWCNQEGHHP